MLKDRMEEVTVKDGRKMKKIIYPVGKTIIFVDEFGKRHNALVTVWWGERCEGDQGLDGKPFVDEPGCNLLYVSRDEKREDAYGRQIERESSVVYSTYQPAHGNYWCHPKDL